MPTARGISLPVKTLTVGKQCLFREGKKRENINLMLLVAKTTVTLLPTINLDNTTKMMHNKSLILRYLNASYDKQFTTSALLDRTKKLLCIGHQKYNRVMWDA